MSTVEQRFAKFCNENRAELETKTAEELEDIENGFKALDAAGVDMETMTDGRGHSLVGFIVVPEGDVA